MTRLKVLVPIGFFICLGILIGGLSIAYQQPAYANAAPPYMAFTHRSVSDTYADSTAALEILPAPGTGYDWMIEAVTVIVLDAESAKTVYIGDEAATSTHIMTVPTDTVATQFDMNCGQGIRCATNSAVQVEFWGTSQEVFINVTAHKEKH